MALELLALPDASAGAIGPGSLAGIQVFRRQGNRWTRVPGAARGTIWDQLKVIDARIKQTMLRMDNPDPAGYLAALRNTVKPLYQAIVSDELHAVIQEAAAVAEPAPPVLRLHLLGGLDIVPWELLHDGTGFLGLRFQVARVPVVPAGPPDENGTAHEVRRIVSLLGEHVLPDDLRVAWESTFANAVGNKTEVVQRPAAALPWPTLANLDDPSGDVVHLTCHGIQDGVDRYWTLNDTAPLKDINVTLYPQDAETFAVRRTAPLVFANACASAAGGGGGDTWFDALGEGFGSSFFDGGARVFVGTFAPVSGRIAVEFARRFFERTLRDQLSVGEALVRTKETFLQEDEPDPSWLFYCLYGEPQATFIAPGGN